MKNSLNIILLSIVLMAGLNLSAQKQHFSENTASLEIEGRIMNTKGAYKVEVRRLSLVPDTFVIEDDRKKFRIYLEKNHCYTIRISKNGFADKLVFINTALPEDLDDLYRFSFDTHLISSQNTQNDGKLSGTLPDAFIYFNKEKDCFLYDRKQTERIREDLLSRAF